MLAWYWWLAIVILILIIIKLGTKKTNNMPNSSQPGILERAKKRISDCCNKIGGNKI